MTAATVGPAAAGQARLVLNRRESGESGEWRKWRKWRASGG